MTSPDPAVVGSADPDPIRADQAARARYRLRRIANAGVVALVLLLGVVGITVLHSNAPPPTPPAPRQVAAAVTPTPTPDPTPSPSATPPVGPIVITVESTTVTTTKTTAHQPPATTASTHGGYAGDVIVPGPPGISTSITAPAAVTLTSDGTVYRGQITVTATNHGDPFVQTLVPIAVPAGVNLDFSAGSPFVSCRLGGPAPYGWQCDGPSIPSGGSVSWVLHLKGDYAPRATDLVLPGLSFQLFPGVGGGVFYTDTTPGNNTANVTVTLAGTGPPVTGGAAA